MVLAAASERPVNHPYEAGRRPGALAAYARGIALVAVAWALLGVASPATGATTSLVPTMMPFVCPVTTMPGQQFTVEVKIDVGPSTVLGAYTLTIDYDATAVHINSIAGGMTAEFSGAPTTNSGSFTTGSTRFNAFQTNQTSPMGVVSVAKITFDVVTATSASGSLDLSVNSMFAADGSPISATGTTCGFTVVGPTTTTTSTTTTSSTTTSSTTTTVTTSSTTTSSTTTSSTTSTVPTPTTTYSTTTSSTTTSSTTTTVTTSSTTTSSTTTSSTTSTVPTTTTTSSTTTSSTTTSSTTTSSTTSSSTTTTLPPTTTS